MLNIKQKKRKLLNNIVKLVYYSWEVRQRKTGPQKRPLLIRGAIPGFECPVDADELAGLACDGEAEARIITQTGDAAKPWTLRSGPFTEADIATLTAEDNYTLVVNGVDRLVPPVADLVELLPFLPRWRIDDVQISYAPAGGSVGPHSDQYDVFLLQAGGRKAWAISDEARYRPANAEAFIPDIDVAVLKEFTPQTRWELAPGDMLCAPRANGASAGC